MTKYLKTSQVAKAVGVHPNAVRIYEECGLIQPVSRNEKGYRLFTHKHLEQMRLARIALRCEFIEADIRKERAKAEDALHIVQKWIDGNLNAEVGIFKSRKSVADFIDVSIGILRNWERNGLIRVSRNLENGYRMYGPQETNRLKVIRTLRKANYSMISILRMMKSVDDEKVDKINEDYLFSEEEDMISATDKWISTLKRTEGDALELIMKLKTMIGNASYNSNPPL